MTGARAMLVVAMLLASGAAVAAQSGQQSGQIGTGQDTVAVGGALLRGLDTLNGRTEDLALRAGETVRFGYLEITLDACHASRTESDGDAYAFLSIRDSREASPRFSGWMFASSPALSALDHPRYDVWVLSCSTS